MSRVVPKYRKHSNGQAFVQHRTINNSSHRLYLGKYGSKVSKNRYSKFLESIKSEEPTISRRHLRSLTLPEVLLLFVKHADKFYGTKSKETRCFGNSINHLLLAIEESRAADDRDLALESIDDFQPRHLAIVQQYMIRKDYCRRHINQTVKRIRRIFKWAVAENLAPRDLYYHLQTAPSLRMGQYGVRESKPVGKVSREWVEITAKYASPQVAAMMRIQFLCGMRPGEVCIMRPMDIDRSEDIWLFRPETHKTQHQGKDLIKAIGKEAQEILNPFLDRAEDQYLFSPVEAEEWRLDKLKKREKQRKPRSMTRLNGKYNTNSFRRAVVYAIEKAIRAGEKIGRWCPLQSRHGIATHVDVALGREATQKWLGHANMDTTAIYTEREIEELKSIARTIDANLAT